MSKFKDISTLVNENTYSKVLKISDEFNISADKLINDSLEVYMQSENRKYIYELIDGYQKNANFNLNYAEMCLSADNESMALCEEKLSESE